MTLSELIEQANAIADEQETSVTVTGFINDAIAKINIRLKANLPYMSADLPDEEPIFPEKWQRAVLIPFAVGRIKQKDSSQFEYTDAYNEFMLGLDDMAAQYIVPEILKDDTYASVTSDIYTNPPFPHWRW